MGYIGITHSQHCDNDNDDIDDNMVRESVWIEFLGG